MVRKVTIDTLAVMVKKGFDDADRTVNKRFDEVDKRFDRVEGRLVNVESDVSYLKSRVSEIGRTLNEHTGILGEHTAVLREHTKELQRLHKKFDELTDPKSPKRVITYKEFFGLESRVVRLEKRVASQIK